MRSSLSRTLSARRAPRGTGRNPIATACAAAVETLESRQLMSVSFTGATYAQDFDAVSGTAWTNDVTLTGWHLFRQPTPGTAITGVAQTNGGSNAGTFALFATGGSSDRALGGVGSGGTYFGNPAQGTIAGWQAVSLTNNTGSTVASFDVKYDGEQWRNGGNTSAQTMTLQYGFGASFTGVATWTNAGAAFDFTSTVNTATAGALDGNAAANRTANIGGTISAAWAAGQTLWVRWAEVNEVGSDHGLAVDNFSLSTGGVTPTNSVVTLSPAANGSINESGGSNSITYTVTRTNPTADAVTVNYAIGYSGTATSADLAGSPTTGSVTIPANQASATFTLTAFDDTTEEAAENFTVTLTSIQSPVPANHSLGGTVAGSFTITANDAPPPPPATLGKAPTLVAVVDGTQNFGNTQRSIAYYDVSNIDNSGNPGGLFGSTPLFSVWSGFEQTANNNYEEISALAVNPANGDTYVLSFDSGVAGNVDVAGDTEGDYDLYRYDIGKIYADFIANGRTRGTMYMPAVSSDGFDALSAYGSATPALNGGLGIHPNRDNTDGDTTNDFVFINAIEKIAEVGRVQQVGTGSNFFDQQDLQFVDSETLLLLENKRVSDPATATTLQDDYSIRSIERVSLTPNQATTGPNDTGGYANTNSTESWSSVAWTGANAVDMDNFAGGGGISEARGMRYVEKDGVKGVWLVEDDGAAGDDFEFRTLDFNTHTVTQPGGYSGFAADNVAGVGNDNGGNVDGFDVDEEGTIVVYESGFLDSPQHEPAVQTVAVTNYGSGPVTLGASAQEPTPSPTLDDDADVVDGRFSVYERGQNRVYRFDLDSGADPAVRADVYVYDLDTNTLVYEELNAINHFLKPNGVRVFTLGDFATDAAGNSTSQDGIVDAKDIDALAARIADPTFAGKFSSAIGQEMFDLDGDDVLTIGDPYTPNTVTGDTDYLVRRILATEFGDADLNGTIDGDDFFFLDSGFFGSATGWANGDFDGNGVIDGDDYFILDNSFIANPIPSRV